MFFWDENLFNGLLLPLATGRWYFARLSKEHSKFVGPDQKLIINAEVLRTRSLGSNKKLFQDSKTCPSGFMGWCEIAGFALTGT